MKKCAGSLYDIRGNKAYGFKRKCPAIRDDVRQDLQDSTSDPGDHNWRCLRDHPRIRVSKDVIFCKGLFHIVDSYRGGMANVVATVNILRGNLLLVYRFLHVRNNEEQLKTCGFKAYRLENQSTKLQV